MAQQGVRIISGRWKQSVLQVCDVQGLRPTLVRLRKTLSDWVRPYQPLQVAELFAGSGSTGFELASQGASRVVMVEKNPVAVAALHRNAARLEGASEIVEIIAADSMRWHSSCSEVFDLVVLDPPFAANFEAIAAVIAASGICAMGGMIYSEQPKKQMCRIPRGWKVQRETTSGRVVAQLWVRETAPDPGNRLDAVSRYG